MPAKRDEVVDAAERATRLRKEIERLKIGKGSDRSDSDEQKAPLSPREFINKRMADLNKKS